MMQIHVQKSGKNFGPYSLDTVKQYLADGSLSALDLAWHKELPDWVPLGQIAGVEVAEAEPLPPPPPNTLSEIHRVEDSAPLPVQKAPASQDLPEGRVDFFAAVSFPFQQNNLVSRGWWVPLVNFSRR